MKNLWRGTIFHQNFLHPFFLYFASPLVSILFAGCVQLKVKVRPTWVTSQEVMTPKTPYPHLCDSILGDCRTAEEDDKRITGLRGWVDASTQGWQQVLLAMETWHVILIHAFKAVSCQGVLVGQLLWFVFLTSSLHTHSICYCIKTAPQNYNYSSVLKWPHHNIYLNLAYSV